MGRHHDIFELSEAGIFYLNLKLKKFKNKHWKPIKKFIMENGTQSRRRIYRSPGHEIEGLVSYSHGELPASHFQ